MAYHITDPFEHELPSVSVPHSIGNRRFQSQTITLGKQNRAGLRRQTQGTGNISNTR